MSAIREEANRVWVAIESFPSVPYVVGEIVRSLDDDNMTPQLLAKKVESDPGMVAGVLRRANSCCYTVKGGITTIPYALVVIGFNAVRSLACMEGLFSHFDRNAHGAFDIEGFMRHSIGAGCCAKFVAKAVGSNHEIAFVSGILHDVGQLAIAKMLPDENELILEHKRKHDCHITQSEQAVLGADHAEIGAHLMRCWGFPSVISEAIGAHHVSGGQPSRMGDIVHVAEVLSHAMDFGGHDKVPFLSEEAMYRLGCSLQQLRRYFDEIEDEYLELTRIFALEGRS